LGCKDLWFDEAFSYWHAQTDSSHLLDIVTGSDASMPLYFWFLHLWVNVGESEWILRLPSLVFGAGAVAAVYLVGVRLIGNPAGWIAAFLLAVNPFFVGYSQEARGYTLVLFLLALSTYLLIRALGSGGPWWVAYVVSASLAIYAHAFAIPVVLAQLGSSAYSFPFPGGFSSFLRSSWKGIAAGALALLVATAAIALPLLRITMKGGYARFQRPSIEDFVSMLQELAGNDQYIAAMVFVLCLWGVLGRSADVVEGRSFDRWRESLVVSLLIIPLLLPLSISIFRPIIGFTRYLIVILLGLSFLCAKGIGRLRPSPLRIVVGGALVIALGFASVGRIKEPQIEGWSTAAAVVMERGRSSDGLLVFDPTCFKPFSYYADRYVDPPIDRALIPSLSFSQASNYSPLPGDMSTFIAKRASDHPRLWVVLSHTFDERARWDFVGAVHASYELVSTDYFGGGEVRLYERLAR
jgi:4-amino-4-deoxy-L-arabinose transferase-like glycosyltransferase